MAQPGEIGHPSASFKGPESTRHGLEGGGPRAMGV